MLKHIRKGVVLVEVKSMSQHPSFTALSVDSLVVKVTVQFETEGNGQNKIVSNMDRLIRGKALNQ